MSDIDVKVNLVGDSHVFQFGKYPQIRTHYLGARTAYQIAIHHEHSCGLVNRQHQTHSMAYILECYGQQRFCFLLGEIDCRVHIWLKAKENDTSIADGIINTVNRYVEYIVKIRSGHIPNTSIVSIVPTGFEDGSVYSDASGTKYKHYPDYEQRKEITRDFNAALKKKCDEYGLSFIDIHKYLIDEKGDRRLDLWHDAAHCKYTEEIARIIYEPAV